VSAVQFCLLAFSKNKQFNDLKGVQPLLELLIPSKAVLLFIGVFWVCLGKKLV
jgi:hypothetical protein